MRRAGLVVMAALLSAPALAADTARASDRVLAPFLACRHAPDAPARASCYDAALDRLQQAVATRQVGIVDQQQVAQDRRTMFGFGEAHAAPEAKPVKLAKAAPIEDVSEVDSTIVAASPYGYDRWTLRIATGAVWRTTENGISVEPKPGTKIHIHRGLMSNYMLHVGSGRAVRAIRVG